MYPHKIEAYCGCVICCGRSRRLTASGIHPVAHSTLAAPANVPFGTRVLLTLESGAQLEGVVEDRLPGRPIWGVWVDHHGEVETFGTQRVCAVKIL